MSVTTWSRIEPDVSRGDLAPDLEVGIAARVADPLWLLARQWQLGELRGEDGGTPVAADVRHVAHPLDRVDVGAGLVPIGDVPLEVVVERGADPADETLRARGLLFFLDLLDEEGLEARGAAASEQFPDGDAVLAACEGGRLAEALEVETDSERAAVDRVEAAFRSWYAPRAGRAAGAAFVADRQEHTFRAAIAAPEGDLILSVPEHRGGRLDWDAFTWTGVEERASEVATSADSPGAAVQSVVPLPLTLPGMAVPRFWELDDPAFDPSRVAVGRGDAARALLVEMHLAFASDWFLVPLVTRVGGLVRVVELAVTDTFGVRTTVAPADDAHGARRFGLWRVAARGPEGRDLLDGLLVPSTLADGLLGPSLEEVVVVRDQDQNLAWAIERVVPDARGQARPGFQGGRRVDVPAPSPSPPAPSDAPLVYQPMRLPAEAFVPLVLEAGDERLLVRAVRPDAAADASRGRIVGEHFVLRDDELPPEGLTVSRRFEWTRAQDGATHLWIARVKDPGATAPRDDLAFDTLRG